MRSLGKIQGSGGRRKSGGSNWLPYDVSRRVQRDAILGLGLVLVSCLGILLFSSMSQEFSVKFVDGLPQMSDGTPCQLLEVYPYDDPTTPARAMVDCGDLSGLGVPALLQHLSIAVSAVGVLLLLGSVFSLIFASRLPRETLAVPICVLAIIGGLVAVWWSFKTSSPGLAFQGFRPGAVTGYLRTGGSVSSSEGALSFGVSLMAASFVRLSRP